MSTGLSLHEKNEKKLDELVIEKPDILISEWQAGWNLTNNLLGLKVVSVPYLILKGGVTLGFIFNIIAGYIACYTCLILRDCMYEEDDEGNSRRILNTYSEIGEKALNMKYGKTIIGMLQFSQGIIACVVYLIYPALLLEDCFPTFHLGFKTWLMICTVPILSVAFLTSPSKISCFSLIGTLAQIGIVCTAVVYSCVHYQRWRLDNFNTKLNIWLAVSQPFGILLMTYSSAAYAPIVESQMKDKNRFSRMIYWSHILAIVAKTALSVFVLLLWGSSTSLSFTNNLPLWPFMVILNPVLAVKSLTSYPFLFSYSMNIVESFFPLKHKQTEEENSLKSLFEDDDSQPSAHVCTDSYGQLKISAVLFRFAFIIVTMLMGMFLPLIEVLLGILGSIVYFPLLLIFPSYFYLKLKWNELNVLRKFQNIVFIDVGIFCLIASVYFNASSVL